MDAFVAMRHFISNNLIEQKYINNQVLKNTEDIIILQETFDKFKPNNNHIFFERQIYDAYSLMLDIFESSKEEIIIIDNYTDKKLLDLLSKTKRMFQWLLNWLNENKKLTQHQIIDKLDLITM